jgi:hypothetical protein
MRLPACRLRSLTSLLSLATALAACSDRAEPNCPNDAGCGLGAAAGVLADSPAVAPTPPDRGAPESQPASPAANEASEATVSPATNETSEATVSPAALEIKKEPSPSSPLPEPAPEPVTPVTAPQALSDRKVDLLLMVDNSMSMSDKQALLSRTAADFLGQLVNPPCLDAAGHRTPAESPELACPPGQTREFLPVHDINIAVISSSLGDVGANVACAGGERDDRAHLIGSLPRGEGHGTSGAGVLELRPGGDIAQLNANFQGLLDSVGQNGCGWEMSLESWYRFLAEPFPYERLARVSCTDDPAGSPNCVQPARDANGVILLDTALLEQRAAFLRPDSLLAIVMLSDENDCSLQLSPQSWIVTAIDDSRPMFRGSSVCDTNPNDPCCYSCPFGAPPGCDEDPICLADPATGSLRNRLPDNQDGSNLRCFDQKRRFGTDFLYPTERYINALSQRELCPIASDLSTDNCSTALVPNPLLSGGRDPNSVFLAAIVGVPWQEIASDESADGLPLPPAELRFKSPAELDDPAWNALVGSASASPPLPPTNPFMVESTAARPGIENDNPINGREYSTAPSFAPDTPDDLQYACIFPLAEPRDCAALDPGLAACDCYAGNNDRPLCEKPPALSNPGTTQFFAKAYPGLRQLEVLRGHGDNASLGSICARNVSDPSRSDFGYRPAMAALLERMQPRLAEPQAP